MNERKDVYERKLNELNQKCLACRKENVISFEKCNYGCAIGKRIRWLETEYSDVTGYSHKIWKKGV
ncbi:MAG: hypothetical protein E7313_06770 [Clostridiales bacterium]|nr:hypothetical protein [Clostridiales bacterium]